MTTEKDPERLALEERVARLEQTQKAKNQPSRVETAKARLAEIDAKPLPPGARDHVRLARAAERAELMAIAFGLEGRLDHNAHFIPSPPPKDAA